MTNSHHAGQPENESTGNHERFLELCAIATSGALPDKEAQQLRAHLEECPECREAMAEFRFVSVDGASLLVPIDPGTGEYVSRHLSTCDSSIRTHRRLPKSVKRELFARIAAERTSNGFSTRVAYGRSIADALSDISWQRKIQFTAAVLMLLAAVSVGAYQLGARERPGSVWVEHPAPLERPVPPQNSDLKQQLESRILTIDDLRRSLMERAAAVQDLKRQLADSTALQKRAANELSAALAKSTAFESERESLLRRLQEAQSSLVSLQGELDSLRTDKQSDLLRISTLENRVDELNRHLKESQATVAQQQDFLVSDRDVRELMGARNLYITDVVDVDRNGQTQKPFGRIFYTRGKSLIFYAFDLDQQRGLHNAAFQLWGQRGSDRSSPVNMGIFYLDNEANRRWVLKFDNPVKLAEINAVFVTVESNGPSPRPAGKQLLYASLRTLPNHP